MFIDILLYWVLIFLLTLFILLNFNRKFARELPEDYSKGDWLFLCIFSVIFPIAYAYMGYSLIERYASKALRALVKERK